MEWEDVEGDDVEGGVEGTEPDDVIMVGLGGFIEGVTIRTRNLAEFNGWVPADEGEVVFPMIFWPGPISGLSKTHRCEAADRETEKGTHTTDGQRFVEVPITLHLAWAVGSCRGNNRKERTVTSMRAH